MTLRLKINLIVGALTALFIAAVLLLQLRSLRESVQEEVVAANRVAAQLLNRTTWLYAAQGTPAMLAFLQGVGRVRSNEINLFDSSGQELYRSPPSPYKSGREAPEWFARLVGPQPTAQSFEFPGGKLLVQANASRAVLDAWDDAVILVGSAAAMLVLLNALVFWLVGRAVQPFGRIAGAMGTVEAGRFDIELPPLPGREAGAIGAAFNRMVAQLKNHIETERRAVRAESELSASRELARWVDQHIEEERRLIARELHDELGQSVTAMRSIALSVAQRVAGSDAEAERAARLIADEASRLYDAMHGIIPRLAPLVLDSFGLADALADLVERVRRSQPQLQIDLRVELTAVALAPEAALALYRAAQEGMTNAVRHGQARRITIEVGTVPGRLELRVADDGVGVSPGATQRDGHYGLRWLSERVDSLGGELKLGPAEPHGAVLEVQLPLAQGESA